MVWRLRGGGGLGPVLLPSAGLPSLELSSQLFQQSGPRVGSGQQGAPYLPRGPKACSPSLLAPIPATTQRHLLTSEG